MTFLDPAKLLIVAVVAMLVLGPDKIPAFARKASALWADVAKFRASMHEQVQTHLGDIPFAQELRGAKDSFHQAAKSIDPRAMLFQSAGLDDEGDDDEGDDDQDPFSSIEIGSESAEGQPFVVVSGDPSLN
jgi:Sec-independent protein translocase protein TatA